MIISLRDICQIAEQNNMAVAAVNSASLEAIRAAIAVAEQTGYPIIIQHAEAHEALVPLTTVAPVVTSLAERSSAQICFHNPPLHVGDGIRLRAPSSWGSWNRTPCT